MSDVSAISEGGEVAFTSIDEVLSSEDSLESSSTQKPSSPVSITSPRTSSLEELRDFLKKGGSKDAYITLLTRLFGKNLVKKMKKLSLYQELPVAINSQACYMLLGAIGHRITFDDLEQYFAEIKSGNIQTEILNLSSVSFFGKLSRTAADLPNFWISHLLELFRNPVQIVDPDEIPLGQRLRELSLNRHHDLCYTYYDYAVKQLMKEGNRNLPEFPFASRELLAKTAYAATNSTQVGMILPVFNEKTGQLDYYQLESQLHKNGVHAYLFTPRRSQADLPAILTFRGTKGGSSHHRDLDPSGIGKQSYEACSEELLKMLTTYASRKKTPKLELVGHSLGAADCQRTLITLMEKDPSLFKDVALFSYSSPKLDTHSVKKWHRHLDQLVEEEAKVPTFHFSFAYHKKDLVTWIGDAHLTGTSKFFIEHTYLVADSNEGVLNIRHHHVVPFFENGNFNFSMGRSLEMIKSYTQKDLELVMKKLEDLNHSSSWYLALKGLFFKVEKVEDLEKQIDQIKESREHIALIQTENHEPSWFIWSANQVLDYTLKPFIYHTWKLLTQNRS
jgi:hypothetical protein